MAIVKLTGEGKFYGYAGITFESGVPQQVSQDVADYLMATGRFEVAENNDPEAKKALQEAAKKVSGVANDPHSQAGKFKDKEAAVAYAAKYFPEAQLTTSMALGILNQKTRDLAVDKKAVQTSDTGKKGRKNIIARSSDIDTAEAIKV